MDTCHVFMNAPDDIPATDSFLCMISFHRTVRPSFHILIDQTCCVVLRFALKSPKQNTLMCIMI